MERKTAYGIYDPGCDEAFRHAGRHYLPASLLCTFRPNLLYLTAIAIPVGATNGFYYAGNNLGISLFGKGKEFASFFSLTGLIAQIIAFVNPIAVRAYHPIDRIHMGKVFVTPALRWMIPSLLAAGIFLQF
jgi:YQGE family putative transporter